MILSSLGCVRTRAGDALDWLDKNYTADLKSYDQATLGVAIETRLERVFFFCQLESVN